MNAPGLRHGLATNLIVLVITPPGRCSSATATGISITNTENFNNNNEFTSMTGQQKLENYNRTGPNPNERSRRKMISGLNIDNCSGNSNLVDDVNELGNIMY